MSRSAIRLRDWKIAGPRRCEVKQRNFLSPALHEDGLSVVLGEDECRHITADSHTYLRQLLRRLAEFPQHVQRPQHCRSIGRASSKPASNRYPLGDAYFHAGSFVPRNRVTRAFEQDPRRLDAEIVLEIRVARKRTVFGKLDLKGVRKGNRRNKRPEGMVAVRSPGVDLEREVDLGVGFDRHFRRSAIAASTLANSVASFAFGIVENARRMRPDSTIVPVEYFSISCRRTFSASTPIGFTHMK